jgi:translocation protein SEC63
LLELGASKEPLIKSPDYAPPQHEKVDEARRRQAKKERRLKRFTALVLGWAAFGYMCYLIATTSLTAAKIWDPYDILGISTVCIWLRWFRRAPADSANTVRH